MGIFRSIAGMLQVELTSADPAGALWSINSAGIDVFQMVQDGDLTLRFRIRRSDMGRLEKLCTKRGESLKINRRLGLYWKSTGTVRRPLLLFGIALLAVMALYLPSRIFFIRVEGNQTIPARLILAQAEECGIGFGASRREVRSEKMKNALLAAIPELQWAGVNTKGCVAVISVREKSTAQSAEDPPAVSSIYASRDGVIIQSTVEGGTPLCRVGQAVREGELLVSGYTNCEFSIRAVRSVGEIFALTNRQLEVVTPAEMTIRGSQTRQEKKYALIIGKKRINFYKDSGISSTSCDKMSMVNYLTLPGGFALPVALVTEKLTYYEQENAEQLPEQAQILLEEFADVYLKQRMIAGQILKSTQDFLTSDGTFRLTGVYACSEMIGREQPVEIIK